MKPATEILLSAAFVLTPEENWLKGSLARTGDGVDVMPEDPRAVSFCLVGAFSAMGEKPGKYGAREYLLRVIGGCGLLSTFNNTHTHAEVLDALYRAAEIAEAS